MFRKLCTSKSIKQDVCNLETTTTMNLPQPQSQLKQHLETLPKALQGAPRLRPSLPMNLRWSKCHRTGRSCSLRKWLLPPSKCCGFRDDPKRKILLHLASESEVTILGISTAILQCSDLIVCNIFSKRFVERNL